MYTRRLFITSRGIRDHALALYDDNNRIYVYTRHQGEVYYSFEEFDSDSMRDIDDKGLNMFEKMLSELKASPEKLEICKLLDDEMKLLHRAALGVFNFD